MAGCLVSLEGGEASGKSTQVARLARALVSMGLIVVTSREPGGTPFAERLRSLLLDARSEGIEGVTEVLLFAAARAEVFAKVIAPGLKRGAVVLCDRFVDSSLAYQGYGLGLDLSVIREINNRATQGRMPDLTLVLDVPVDVALARRVQQGREGDRIESRTSGFHRAVREGYRALALEDPHRIRWIDGSRPVDEVAGSILAEVLPAMARCGVHPVADTNGTGGGA